MLGLPDVACQPMVVTTFAVTVPTRWVNPRACPSRTPTTVQPKAAGQKRPVMRRGVALEGVYVVRAKNRDSLANDIIRPSPPAQQQ